MSDGEDCHHFVNALQKNHYECAVKIINQYGPNRYSYCLNTACKYKRLDVVEYILSLEISTVYHNYKTNKNILHLVCQKGPIDFQLIELLLEHGVDPNKVDVYNKTPYDLFCINYHHRHDQKSKDKLKKLFDDYNSLEYKEPSEA